MTIAASPRMEPPEPSAVEPRRWLDSYRSVRDMTLYLAEPLTAEDCAVQVTPEASPTKWHLAHSTWFFETFLLVEFDAAHRPLNEDYAYLFNSYYNAVGEQFARRHRGLLTRPSLTDVLEYRRAVDERVANLIDRVTEKDAARMVKIVELGLNHEQQHQELILTDAKALFAANPLAPMYRPTVESNETTNPPPIAWIPFDGGVTDIGHDGPGFCYDNERPRHRVWLNSFQISDRTVTNSEFLEFINDDGYQRAKLWLSDGWDTVKRESWNAPCYWRRDGEDWREFTLGGLRPLRADEPVTHISYFEADAYARWAGARLPTEAEWEIAANSHVAGETGAVLEDATYHPRGMRESNQSSIPRRMVGDVWEWTASSYSAYPGYQPPAGALGEYNAKFMCNQMVLRGGSCATPRDHIRSTYRNFFAPAARWQFSGIRLARNS